LAINPVLLGFLETTGTSAVVAPQAPGVLMSFNLDVEARFLEQSAALSHGCTDSDQG
jgi:hypothetical protein